MFRNLFHSLASAKLPVALNKSLRPIVDVRGKGEMSYAVISASVEPLTNHARIGLFSKKLTRIRSFSFLTLPF